MTEVTNAAFAGTCGFYCGSCSILASYRKGLEQQKKLATELTKQIKRTVKSTEIQCQGCQELSKYCWGRNCKIKSCARAKGLSFCCECASFPCSDYEKLSELYHGIPFLQSKELKETGSKEKWLEIQRERWSCTNCGGPIEAGTLKCLSCNIDCKSHVEKTFGKK